MQATVNDVIRTCATWLRAAGPTRLRALVLAVLVVCLGATPISLGVMSDQPGARGTDLATSTVSPDRSDQTSRGSGRTATAEPARPVAGLSQRQMDHAATIVATGQKMGLPERAYVVAVATAMQETNLRNLANSGLPSSMRYDNDGTGYDHDSVGLFQQRPASGWGPVGQLMDPEISSRKFYTALDRVDGWEEMPLTVAAQTVQGSAFPNAYAKHESKAEAVVDAVTK